MSKAKKNITLIIGLIATFLICVLLWRMFNENGLIDFVIYNDTLNAENRNYLECELPMEAVELDSLIGKTQEGFQVYSIKGIDDEKFVCLRIDGQESIWRNSLLNAMSFIQQLKVDKVVFRSEYGNENIYTAKDKKILNKLISMIDDENVISGELIGDEIRQLYLYSSKYEGLCCKLLYIIDETGEEYLYDSESQTAWKFSSPMFDIVENE